jgi:hypothetical protein
VLRQKQGHTKDSFEDTVTPRDARTDRHRVQLLHGPPPSSTNSPLPTPSQKGLGSFPQGWPVSGTLTFPVAPCRLCPLAAWPPPCRSAPSRSPPPPGQLPRAGIMRSGMSPKPLIGLQNQRGTEKESLDAETNTPAHPLSPSL